MMGEGQAAGRSAAGRNGMAERTQLQAGIAPVTITPDRPLLLEGYGSRQGPATGTLDEVEAQALVLDDGSTRAAIVAADLCGFEAGSAERIRVAAQASGVPGENIMITYSHSHSAPLVTPFAAEVVDSEYLAWMERTIAEAIITASRRLAPVTLGVGTGEVNFTVNRRVRTAAGTVMRANPEGLVDRRVRVLRLDPADAPAAPGTLGDTPLPSADPVAILFSYATHPGVLRDESYLYSGEYPGAARRAAATMYSANGGGAGPPALFLPACFGNLRPHLLAPDGGFRSGTQHELTVLGRMLGSEVVQVAERIVGAPVSSIAMGRQMVCLPYSHVPDEGELRAALSGPKGFWAETLLDQLALGERLPEDEMAEVQVLRVGRHWLVALPGETTLEIGLSIERGLVERGLADPARGDMTLAVGYANGYVGYLCAASVISEGGYEPATSFYEYLRPGPFGPEVEPALVNGALEVAEELGPAEAV